MAVNLARFLGVHPEIALSKSNDKFEKRFRFMEKKAREMGRSLSDMDIDEMEELWQEAKKRDRC
ncbi:MAG: hypothetical protein DSZ25_02190 [Thermovibrio sp.]|nr:MAG: hypothetical protein DSZ25_02190 [Thermovibrio sp.]